MGKAIFIIACILLAITIAVGFWVPQIGNFIGLILIVDIIVLAIGVLMIAKETRPPSF